MSSEFYDYLRGVAEAVLDLVIGYALGSLIDAPFNRPSLRPVSNQEGFMKVVMAVLLETAAAATGLMGVRRLMYVEDGANTLTGGMFFIGAMHMSQCGLWENLAALRAFLTGKLVSPPTPPVVSPGSGSSTGN